MVIAGRHFTQHSIALKLGVVKLIGVGSGVGIVVLMITTRMLVRKNGGVQILFGFTTGGGVEAETKGLSEKEALFYFGGD